MKLDARVNVSLSEKDYSKLQKLANSKGLSTGSYARTIIIEQVNKEKRD